MIAYTAKGNYVKRIELESKSSCRALRGIRILANNSPQSDEARSAPVTEDYPVDHVPRTGLDALILDVPVFPVS